MQVIYTSRAGESWDLTALITTAAWSGDYKQAARSLRITLAQSEAPEYPKDMVGAIDNGEMLRMMSNGQELFRGYIFKVSRKLGQEDREILAYDGLVYLLKSKVSYNFIRTTAQAATRTIASGLGLDVGYMPPDGGIALDFAPIGQDAYAAIMSAWTKVSRASGAKYLLMMDKGVLTVRWMGDAVAAHLIDPASNLINGEASASIESTITRALVVSEDGVVMGSAENAANAQRYGVLQAVERNEEKADPKIQATGLLKGPENQITLSEIIGGPLAFDYRTGHAVGVRVPGLGLVGRFFILNDDHTFSNGQHRIALGLSFDAVMDEHELQELAQREAEAENVAETPTSTRTRGTAPPPATGNIWATAEKHGRGEL